MLSGKARDNVFITPNKIFSHLDALCAWRDKGDVFPITVEVHLTQYCNNRCFYCNYPKHPGAMGLDEFKIVVDKLSKARARAVIFSGGGEPTLHPGISEALGWAAKAGLDCALITNLLRRDERLYRVILEYCAWCRISLDSSQGRLYEKIRGCDGFVNVISNIKKFIALKHKSSSRTTVGLQYVANRHNSRDILNGIKLAADLKVDYIQIRPLETKPYRRLPYSKEEYKRIMRQIESGYKFSREDFKIIRSDKWDIINPYLKRRRHGFSFCHAYEMICAIDVNGDVYVCCHQIETRDKRLCYGNIIREPIRRIMARRKKVIKNLDLRECYLECRGSSINRALEGLKGPMPHANFL